MRGSRQRLRRESQLDEGPNALREQAVIELIDLLPVVYGSPVDHAHRAQHVVEDGVKANVAESELVDCRLQLRLTVGPDQGAGIVRPDRQVEESIQRPFGSRQIDRDLAGTQV